MTGGQEYHIKDGCETSNDVWTGDSVEVKDWL